MMYGRARWQEVEATRKDFNAVLIRQDKKFFTFELSKVIQDAISIDPSLQDNVFIPNNFFECIYHIGCAVNLHSITKFRIDSRRTKFQQGQTDVILYSRKSRA